MYFDQLHTDGRIEAALLGDAVAAALGVERAAVEVVSALAAAAWGSAKIVVEARVHGGEMKNRLGIHFAEGFTTAKTQDAVAAELARRLNVRVVRDDGTPNPFGAVLFHPNGAREAVFLDVDALGERDEVVLAAPAKTATVKKPARKDRVEALRRLRTYYAESPLPSLPASKEQHASHAELHRQVFALSAPPLAAQDAQGLREAVARVRATWPIDQQRVPGSTLATLLEAAALLLEDT